MRTVVRHWAQTLIIFVQQRRSVDAVGAATPAAQALAVHCAVCRRTRTGRMLVSLQLAPAPAAGILVRVGRPQHEGPRTRHVALIHLRATVILSTPLAATVRILRESMSMCMTVSVGGVVHAVVIALTRVAPAARVVAPSRSLHGRHRHLVSVPLTLGWGHGSHKSLSAKATPRQRVQPLLIQVGHVAAVGPAPKPAAPTRSPTHGVQVAADAAVHRHRSVRVKPGGGAEVELPAVSAQDVPALAVLKASSNLSLALLHHLVVVQRAHAGLIHLQRGRSMCVRKRRGVVMLLMVIMVMVLLLFLDVAA